VNFFALSTRLKKIALYLKKYRAKLKKILGNFSSTFQPKMEKILARNEMKISLGSFFLSAEGFF
jgi:hypothetical protein